MIKRIEEVCHEFDERVEITGVAIARLEMVKACVELEADLAEALRLLEPFADFYFAMDMDGAGNVSVTNRYKAAAEFVKAHK